MKENEWHELVYDEEQLKNLIINIGKNVKVERESKNYSISQLCERANISSLHLCRIEKGNKSNKCFNSNQDKYCIKYTGHKTYTGNIGTVVGIFRTAGKAKSVIYIWKGKNMIKCEGGEVILDGEWKQIMTEYLCLSKKIIERSDKIYSGGLNPTIPQLMQNLEKK